MPDAPVTDAAHEAPGAGRSSSSIWSRWLALPLERRYLLLLLVAFTCKQLFLVIAFPPFTGHDEVAHFSYIRTVWTEQRVPVLVDLEAFRGSIMTPNDLPGDYLPPDLYRYCRYVLDWYCEPNNPRWQTNPPYIVTVAGVFYPSGWQYAANHPPLYYMLMAPAYGLSERWSTETQLYLLRTLAIPFGLIVVLCAYGMTRQLFPRERFLAMAVPTFVALQPQISYEAAMVNNDIAGIAVTSLLLYLLARGLRREFTWRLSIAIGATLGFGLLFKSTALTVTPAIAMAMVLGLGLRRPRLWVPRGALVALVGGLIASPWYLLLWSRYGNLSGLDQIAANQWAWTYVGKTPPTLLGMVTNGSFHFWRWREFWGEFGWRLIGLDRGLLIAIAAPLILMAAGLVWLALGNILVWRGAWNAPGLLWRIDRVQATGLLVALIVFLAAYGAMMQFGTRFALTQARYVFPAINAFALLIMAGGRALIPRRASNFAAAGVLLVMVMINLIILTQYVLPYWHLAS